MTDSDRRRRALLVGAGLAFWVTLPVVAWSDGRGLLYTSYPILLIGMSDLVWLFISFGGLLVALGLRTPIYHGTQWPDGRILERKVLWLAVACYSSFLASIVAMSALVRLFPYVVMLFAVVVYNLPLVELGTACLGVGLLFRIGWYGRWLLRRRSTDPGGESEDTRRSRSDP